MAYENVRNTVPGVDAAADLSAKQFFFVKMTATGVNLAGDGEHALGVLQNKPDALGKAATVASVGSTSKVVTSGVVTQGDNVSSDANGKATESASGDYILGQALSTSAADGDLITVHITMPGRLA